ncbi:MAG: sigma-70 family RNA polymerase sigma factor, partial [Planctomycetota bacterium]
MHREPDQTPISLLDRLRASQGERDWEQFIEVYDGLIARWLQRAGVAEADAEDLKQEIMVALVKAVPEFQHNGHVGAFRKWLKTLVTQRVLNHFRARRVRSGQRYLEAGGDELLAIEDRMLTDEWEQEHDRHVLAELMKLVEVHFTATTWTAFRRQVLEHQPAENVAASLGITANAALIAKSRVLRR